MSEYAKKCKTFPGMFQTNNILTKNSHMVWSSIKSVKLKTSIGTFATNAILTVFVSEEEDNK